ncbi:MAG: alpha/beta fold hydrolase [Acidobacteriaceae bacterium]|nr:alpha/beta fold hydrolase [Acidobacteriaceae bacterium]
MLPHQLRVVYLHGFASSPASRKAKLFSANLRALGYSVDVPDLAQGDFEHLTLTGQLRVIEETALGEPLILIGSSMGGYLAALYAARHPEVDRLVLLAPAFGLYQLWVSELGPERLAHWKQEGSLPFFHYGEEREMPLSFGLMEDASHFEPFPRITQPALVFHGDQDESVPVGQSLEFLRVNPHARLVRLQSGHELTDVLSTVWRESESFISAIPGGIV